MDAALCAQTDPDMFHPDDTNPNTKHIHQTCARCDVREQCLNYAIDNNITDGWWGGQPPRARRQLRQRRAA
jgi:WhiB family redox-sensing transcriptional regulator